MSTKTRKWTALSRLQFIWKAVAPECCGQRMVPRYLHGNLSITEMEKMTEEEYAEHVMANAILPPVFTCDKCDNESEIPGLDWPEPKRVEEPETPAVEPHFVTYNFCPHCGKNLPKGNP